MYRMRQTLFALLALSGLTFAQPPSAADGAADVEPLACTVIGASLSNGTSLKILGAMLGFGDMKTFAEKTLARSVSEFELRVKTDSVGMRQLLRKITTGDPVSVVDCSDTMFFQSPATKGEKQLQRAKRRQGLVLGLDFMVWFGYGGVSSPRGTRDAIDVAIHRAMRRLDKQQKAFDLLDQYLIGGESTIVLGDYPDMTGAVERMLPKSAIPRKSTLAELNRRLYRWAASRKQVRIYPLAARVASARAGKLAVTLEGEASMLHLDQLLQLDRLHPTKLGMAIIASDMMKFLRDQLPELAERLPWKSEFGEVVDALQQQTEWRRRAELLGKPAAAGVGK